MKTNPKEPAFPSRPDDNLSDIGLTKHEYFAVIAMQGLLSNPNYKGNIENTAADAKGYANQLIYELNQ